MSRVFHSPLFDAPSMRPLVAVGTPPPPGSDRIQEDGTTTRIEEDGTTTRTEE